MEPVQDVLLSRWPRLKDRAWLHWSRITEDDLNYTSGEFGELVVLLQQRYGYGKAQAEKEVTSWLNSLGLLEKE